MQHEMGIMSSPRRPATASGAWSSVRGTGVSADMGDDSGSVERLAERLGDLERLFSPRGRNQRHQPHAQTGFNNGSLPPNIPVPAQPNYNQQLPNIAYTTQLPPQVAPTSSGNPAPMWTSSPTGSANFQYPPAQAPIIPPPRSFSAPIPVNPSIGFTDESLKDFSLCAPQEYFMHETGLYQRINFHAKIRLGYGKAIAVLQRELEGLPTYEQIIRPYQIDQPENLPDLSPLIPNSEARLFADTVRALVDIIGLQRSVLLLEAAKANEVPGIKYEIQRVPIPPPSAAVMMGPPIPLEPESIAACSKVNDIGPFARGRSESITSATSSAPTMYSWTPTPMGMNDMPPPPAPHERVLSPPPISSDEPATPPPVTATPHRGILRRSSSGTPKRVTIQTDRDCGCVNHHFCSSPPYEPVMSPVAMSPITRDATPPPIDVSQAEYHHALGNAHNRALSGEMKPTPFKAEENVLQAMAAAQM